MMVSMSIALTIAAILSLASAKYAINKFNEEKGALIGNQLQTLTNALAAYIDTNNSALSQDDSRTGASNLTLVNSSSLLPSIQKLISDGFLSHGFNPTPSFGSSYLFKIEVTHKTSPSTKCTTDCNIRGFVYLSQPITTSGSTTDIRLLGAAVEASPKKHIGYSLPQSPTLITGPGGWTESNPDTNSPQRAGILLAVTSLGNENNNLQYWLKPAPSFTSLPASLNADGDGRITLDTYKPYIWRGTLNTPKWSELFSNDETQSLSLGAKSGSTTATISPASSTRNTFIGYFSGGTNKNGYANLFIGPFSGYGNTGSNNIFLGSHSGYSIASDPSNTPNYNIFIGNESGRDNKGDNSILIGHKSGFLNTTGSSNVFIGHQTGYNNLTGKQNSYTGMESGFNNTDGSDNVFTGYKSGRSNKSGINNVFQGSLAGFSNTLGSNNLFSGYSSGFYNTTGLNNSFTGSYAGLNNTSGNDNLFSGYKSGYMNSESYNTFVGSLAGQNLQTGSYNLIMGYAAGRGSISGYTSNYNTFLGSSITSANNISNSTAIGYNSNITASNSTVIGANAYVTTPNTVRIGSDTVTLVNIGNANLNTTGSITTSNIICPTCTPLATGSDKRLKDNITDTPRDLSFIKKLRPVDYTLVSNGKPQTGFIAQEVELADRDFPGIVKPQNDSDFYALTYTAFIPAIVKSIQQLDARLEKLAPAASVVAPSSISASGSAVTSADISLLKWLVLFLSACVLSCLAVIVRFYKELKAMRLSVQRMQALIS